MTFAFQKFFAAFVIATLLTSVNPAQAGSLGDFFKSLGNSIAHPGQSKKPKPAATPASKKSKTKSAAQSPPAEYPPSPAPVAAAAQTPTPTATSTLPPVLPASAPPVKNLKRDIPYGIPVPGKTGFVTSPYSPKAGFVDVRGFPSGTEVKDPYSGKIFLTP
jgi:hypothetical protein